MNYILIDVAIAALLLFTIWSGYRKGFVLTLCGFLAIFVALIGASILSDALAEPAAKAIQPVVERSIQEYVNSSVSISPADPQNFDPNADIDLPLESLLRFLERSGIYEGFVQAFQKAVDAGVVEVTANAVQTLAGYIAVQIARVVLFLLAFAAISIAWFVLSHALDLAFKLPVLSTLNQWAGAAVGLVKGLVLVFIAVWLLKDSFIPPEAMESSYLLPLFAAGPMSLLSTISQ